MSPGGALRSPTAARSRRHRRRRPAPCRTSSPCRKCLGEIARSGPSSKTVERGYGRLLSALGPELDILQSVPLEDISRADSSVLAEAVARLRAGKVIRDAGYDGEYGVIRLFEPDE
jgi:DNA helicase II / ATP-dependent DNA helicase PcrA